MKQTIIVPQQPGSRLPLHRLCICLITVLATCCLLGGCSKSQQAMVEAPLAYQPSPEASLPDVPKLPAKANEVQLAVKRVFKDAAQLDSSREPNFIAGDFNGDHSQDIAVVIKPASGRIAEMNDPFPAWIVRDPFAGNRASSAALHIEEDEVLLAVIHGYGANDWRDPQATQTFLLKNAVGSGFEVQKEKDFLKTNAGNSIPPLQGDLIGEVIRGTSGYIYYTGATYSWFNPKTFKPEPVKPVVHPGITPKS